jgi:D-sedoheptulose 7-phosphate isomerase
VADARTSGVMTTTQDAALAEWRRLMDQLKKPDLMSAVHAAGAVMVSALESGHKILFAGNGGSAAEASHLAAEFVGRCTHDRPALPAVALNDSSTSLTAVGNDYGYDEVFARGVRALGAPGDVFVGLSTSGGSANVRRALEVAAVNGLTTVAMTGMRGTAFASMADHALVAPSTSTPRIQEVHLMWGHVWCEAVDELWCARPASLPVHNGSQS